MPDIFKSALHKQIANHLERDRYARIPANFIGTQGGDLNRSRAEFLQCNHKPMPIDRYNSRGVRRRRLGKFVRIPSSGHLEPIPPEWDPDLKDYMVGFFQRYEFNPEQGGKQRRFSSLLPDQYQNLFLRTAIEDCATVIYRKDPTQPEYVNVHIVQVVATPDEPGFSSPPLLHRDGEFFTFAFLLQRYNIVGGENVIGTLGAANKHPDEVEAGEILTRFTLLNPWEGYVVDDHGVSHFVDSIVLDEATAPCGWRSVLLIDFTPAIPDPGIE